MTTHDWRQVLSLVLKHWKKSVAFFVAVMLLCSGYILFAPRKYRSTAKYMVRLGHESVGLDPTATVGETMGLYRTSDSVVRSIHEILKSQSLAAEVINEVGVNYILDFDPDVSPSLVTRLKQVVQNIDPISMEEKALITFQQDLKVTSPNQSNVVIVSYDAPSPEMAHRIMQAVTSGFLREHARVNQTQGSFEFFQEQNDVLEASLAEASSKLKNAKNEYGVSSVEGKRINLEGRLENVESSLLALERSLVAGSSTIEQLTEMLKDTPTEVSLAATSGVDDEATAGMRQQLYNLEIRENELLSRFSEDHPEVGAIRKQLDEAKRIFAQMNSSRTETSRGINPVHQQLSIQLLTERAEHESMLAERSKLEEQLEKLRSELVILNEQELEIFHLKTAVDVAKSKYEEHATKLEQARLDNALSQKDISSIGVIEHPRLNERPAKPSKKLIGVLGFLIAVAGAFCLPFAIEYVRGEGLPSSAQLVDAPPKQTIESKAGPEEAESALAAHQREWEEPVQT